MNFPSIFGQKSSGESPLGTLYTHEQILFKQAWVGMGFVVFVFVLSLVWVWDLGPHPVVLGAPSCSVFILGKQSGPRIDSKALA